MGCYDVTCCISGLSIRHDEPIYFGVIVPTEFGSITSYACSKWQFLMPPFEGEYNDYGFVEPKTIQPRDMWDWLVKLWAPHLVAPKQYAHITESNDPHVVFDDFICERRVFANPLHKDQEVRCKLWYCHKWAFEAIEKMSPPSWWGRDDKYKESIERYVNHGYMSAEDDARLKELSQIKYEELTEDQHKERRKLMKDLFANYEDIEWDHGFFSPHFRHTLDNRDEIFYNVLKDFREPFKQALIRTRNFTSNLWCIRKGIQPDLFHGEQHDWHEHLIPWTALVAKQAKLLIKKREEE